MHLFKLTGVACAAAILSASGASAAPMMPRPTGAEAPVTAVAMLRKGTAAGMAKQRHRTRLNRCNNVPSRC